MFMYPACKLSEHASGIPAAQFGLLLKVELWAGIVALGYGFRPQQSWKELRSR